MDGAASLDTVHTFCPAQTEQLIHKNCSVLKSLKRWKFTRGAPLHWFPKGILPFSEEPQQEITQLTALRSPAERQVYLLAV